VAGGGFGGGAADIAGSARTIRAWRMLPFSARAKASGVIDSGGGRYSVACNALVEKSKSWSPGHRASRRRAEVTPLDAD
jgi:hypothetical protein